MKNETRELLGFKVQVTGVCETLAEVIAAAGSEQAVVNDVNNQTLAHSHFTVLRRVIIKELETRSGIKRFGETEGEGEKAKFVVTEKDAAYVARLEEEKGEDWLKSQEAEISAACAKVAVDYKPGVRGAGGSVMPAKKYLAYYDAIVAEDKLAAFCARHSINLDQDEEDLKIEVANKVKDLLAAAQAEATRKAMDV